MHIDVQLFVAIATLVCVSAFLGALARDVFFAFGAASWSRRAFSRIGLDEDGIDWDEVTEGGWEPELPYQRWLRSTDLLIERADRAIVSA